MRKLIMAFLFCFASSIVNAQVVTVEKPVVCSDVKTIIESLSGQYEEKPLWSGSDEKSRYIMLVNPKTLTWSVVQYNNSIACILATGLKSTLINSEKINTNFPNK